ncbi:hypothetical protein CUN63_28375 [Pseudomonas sp. ACM7]|nr:hypothetical protein CUN63_28375 [Pseudomonas sp. ACM7]
MGEVEEGADCNGRRSQVEPVCAALCSSCRACEAAFGCVAVVKSDTAVCQKKLAYRIDDCFAAERSLAGSAAATKVVIPGTA